MRQFTVYGPGLSKKAYWLIKLQQREEALSSDPQISHRYHALQRFDQARHDGLTATQAAVAVGISRATLYRWRRRYGGNPGNLAPYSRRPHTVRSRSKRTPALFRQVRAMRGEYAWGKNKIAAVLRRDGWEVSAATVGRVITKLLKEHKIARIRPGRCHARSRAAPRFWARRQRPFAPSAPGDLVQFDSMYVTSPEGTSCLVINAIDVVSRQAWCLAVSGATSASARRALERVCAEVQPRQVQVDGGSEFKGAFEQACAERDIPLHVLPPRSPKLNGHVESFNGLLRREFFNFYRSLPGEIALLNEALQAFLQDYHHQRPHQALRFKTPAQCYNLPAPTDRVSLSHMY